MNRQATTDSFWIKAERPLDEHSSVIRRQAEEQLRKSTADVSGMPSENIQKLVYELQVHQIELELQNEELKRTQQELMISRERYVKLYNSGTIGYLTLSREGVILHANHAAEELLNSSKEKLINTKLGRFIHPSDQDTYYRFIKNFTAQPTQKSQVFRLNTVKEADNNPPCLGYKLTHCTKEDCNNNNNNIYIECHHAVNNDDIDNPDICLALYDITERRRAEKSVLCLNEKLEGKVLTQTTELIDSNINLKEKIQELHYSEAQLKEREANLKSIFNASVDGIITTDIHGIIVSVNPAITDMFGYEKEELVGESFFKLTENPQYKRNNAHKKKYPKTPIPKMIGKIREIEGFRKDGTSIPIDLSVAQLTLAGHSFFTSILRDVSSRKEQEQLDKIHLDELAHVTRLGLMGQMASGIAHELNQPLAAIASYTEACLNFMKAEQMDMVKIRDTCIKVHQQSLRAGQIIHGMRDFVKYKSVRRETLEVNKLIHDSVNLCTSDLKLNAINLCLDLRPEPLFVHVDNIQIEQVIINLIKNSIDALHKIPWITPRQLSIQTKLNEQRNVEIRIKDNGLGINDKEKANILTPFFTTKPDGMGMGLSISHSIIKAHEGTMHFHSKIGKGTTFYFTLPQQ